MFGHVSSPSSELAEQRVRQLKLIDETNHQFPNVQKLIFHGEIPHSNIKGKFIELRKASFNQNEFAFHRY